MKPTKTQLLQLNEALRQGRSAACDAVIQLTKQGSGNPHWVSLNGLVGVPLEAYEAALVDAVKNRKRYNRGGLSLQLAEQLLSNTVTWEQRGWTVLLHVFGAHAQFDYGTNLQPDVWTTRPYLCVNLRVQVKTELDWSIPLDFRADILLPELQLSERRVA